MAKASSTLDSLFANIWVIVNNIATNDIINSGENMVSALVIIKNQNENPAVTANDLNLGEDNSILNRIDKSHQTSLC